jgi:hypothetical protein
MIEKLQDIQFRIEALISEIAKNPNWPRREIPFELPAQLKGRVQ